MNELALWNYGQTQRSRPFSEQFEQEAVGVCAENGAQAYCTLTAVRTPGCLSLKICPELQISSVG
jgi:hypothetical protein